MLRGAYTRARVCVHVHVHAAGHMSRVHVELLFRVQSRVRGPLSEYDQVKACVYTTDVHYALCTIAPAK